MMLLYLFLISHVFYSASCTIACYNCPIDKNTFDYLVTSDKMPTDLSNCSTITIGDTCLMDVIWSQSPNATQIGFSARGDERSPDVEHALFLNVNLEKKPTGYIWSKGMSYTCSTDNCNSLPTLKRLLASLTLTDNFEDAKDLLREEKPFDGNWCHLETNSTSRECNTAVPASSCQECSFQGKSVQGLVDYCSNCLTTDIGEIFMAHEVDFNITDRTRADHWMLVCRFPDCNTNTYGNTVRENVKSHFDFAQFLNETSKGSKATVSSLILAIAVFSLTILTKRLH